MQHRLAARAHARQLQAVRRSEAAARAASRGVRLVWGALLRLLRDAADPWHASHEAARLAVLLGPAVEWHTAGALAGVARWGHDSAARALADALPVAMLRGMVNGHPGIAGGAVVVGRPGADIGRGGLLAEGLSVRPDGWLSQDFPTRRGGGSGGRRFLEQELSPAVPTFLDLLAPLRSPSPLTTDQARALFLRLLFPAPTEQQVHAVVYGSGWQQRLAASTRLARPDEVAGVVFRGILLGQTPREIARALRPVVQGVESSARRIARTEAMRVAGRQQEAAAGQLGDLVVGWQVHATLDGHTRPWHRQRDGTVYYLDPGPGQKGMAQCPHPPDEAADPTARPPGTPRTAYNCRCFLMPVLRG